MSHQTKQRFGTDCTSKWTVLVNDKRILTYDQLNETYSTGKCLHLNTGGFRNLVCR